MPKKLRDLPVRVLQDVIENLESAFPESLPTPDELGTETGRMKIAARTGHREVIGHLRSGIAMAMKDSETSGTKDVPEAVMKQAAEQT